MTSSLPTNTIAGAIDLGPMGSIDPTSHRFYRFMLNDQFLQKGTIFETVYFKFTVASPDDFLFWSIAVENPGGSSFLRFYDSAGVAIADNSGGTATFAPPASYTGAVEAGTYYLQIAPGSTLTSTSTFGFALEVLPLDALGRDLVGDSEATALDIGQLQSGASVSDSETLHSLYNRSYSPSGSSLSVTVPSTYTVSDQTDVYKFTLAESGTVKFKAQGQFGACVLTGPGQGQLDLNLVEQISDGESVNLIAGDYFVTFYDSATSVIVGGQITTFRQDWEVYDRYTFGLRFTAANGTNDLTAAITGLTLGGGIGSQPNVLPGGIVTVAYTIANAGTAKASAGDIGFYLSTDSTITTDDTLIVFANAFNAVPAGGLLQLTTQITLPGTLSDGTYYIGVIADIGNDVPETNETNNASTGVSFVVAGGGSVVTISSNGGGAAASLQIDENSTSVTRVQATGTGLSYSITGGSDAALFSINAKTGALRFVAGPDFENPADAGADNVYDVIVQASNGSAADSQALAITIANIGGAAIIGTLGDDTISRVTSAPGQPNASSEEDVIYALGGRDKVSSGDGNDTIDGGDGRDHITGGLGKDRMTGGGGADIFIFRSLADSGNSTKTCDVILDFKHGVDRIDLSAIDAISNGGTANDAFIVGGTVVPGVLGIEWTQKETTIFLNTDNDAEWESIIVLKGRVDFLGDGDFIL